MFKIFNNDRVGADQLFLPRIIQSSIYRLSDVIERRSKNIISKEDDKFIEDFILTSLRFCKKNKKFDKLILNIKEFYPKKNWYKSISNINNYIDKKWKPVCMLDLKKNKLSWNNFKIRNRKYFRKIN